MIDLVCIFTTGGVILFYKTLFTIKFDVVDTIIKKVLIHEKNAETSYYADPYDIRWKFA